ncbi:uncharacterized protein miip [Pristis pectinata]|uniref:uncharacterized protein miip n=1 Tax=Pristis pectinata TaxID=685728 RepID=UPI00223DA1A6|nr:uncharacterized protein miip [Pristis pectinata]
MSYSERLQFLRDQNKHLLQRLREERLQFVAPSSMPQPPKSNNGFDSAENEKTADSQGNNYRANRLEQGDGCCMRNPSLKYKTCELLGQEMKNDVLQQPSEVVMSESLQKREDSRAALCTPSMHRAKKQGWTLGSGDGASMELADKLPVNKAKAFSSAEKNCSVSAVLSPEESRITAETLGQKWDMQKLSPQSSHVTECFQSSTPFTKPPLDPTLTDQPELPVPPSQSSGGTGCRQSSSQHYSQFLQSFSENPKPRSKLDPPLYVDQLLDVGNDRHSKHFIRNTQKPKSILMEPHDKMVKADMGHVTFMSPDEESSLNTEVQSVQPLLGYDWIAGLIDVDSPLSEKSEQYFLELQNFRRVNKEECVHQEYVEEEDLNDTVTDQEELSCNSQNHQCTHSYRVNSRLFAVPLEPAAACPLCKTPKSKRPHTMEEPAYIRVSIPRSTLLPPHKYKPHCRKSFNPTDSLSLPSCSNLWRRNAETCKENEFYYPAAGRCCSFCPPGKYRELFCTPERDTICNDCPHNTYKEEWSRSYECIRCVGTCSDPLRQVQSCTQTTKQICECKPGMFCKTPSRDYCLQCVEHSMCNVGEFLIEAGTSTKDNVCGPCPAGTFSDKKSVSTKCQPHTKCAKLIKEGTTTKDAECDESISPVTSTLQTITSRLNSSKTSTSSPVRFLTTLRVDHLTTLSIAVTTPRGNKQMVNLLLIVGLVLAMLLILIVSSLLFSHKNYFKSLLLSNRTKGSIYIMSPRTVYVGVETSDCVSPNQKDPIVKPPESHIHFPQQESMKSQNAGESHVFPVEEEGKIFHDPVPAADC